MATYHYNVPNDLPLGVDTNLLQIQVNTQPIISNGAICTSIVFTQSTGDVAINMSGALTAPQQASLSVVVHAHTPIVSAGYVFIVSALADSNAIQIINNNLNGG